MTTRWKQLIRNDGSNQVIVSVVLQTIVQYSSEDRDSKEVCNHVVQLSWLAHHDRIHDSTSTQNNRYLQKLNFVLFHRAWQCDYYGPKEPQKRGQQSIWIVQYWATCLSTTASLRSLIQENGSRKGAHHGHSLECLYVTIGAHSSYTEMWHRMDLESSFWHKYQRRCLKTETKLFMHLVRKVAGTFPKSSRNQQNMKILIAFITISRNGWLRTVKTSTAKIVTRSEMNKKTMWATRKSIFYDDELIDGNNWTKSSCLFGSL